MGDGYSFESFGAVADVGKSTLYAWQVEYPEFSEAHKRGIERNRHAWETTLIGIANGALDGSATAAIFALKNLFKNDWRDSHDLHVGEGVKHISVDHTGKTMTENAVVPDDKNR